ncbi:type II toxin-antitoxin system mRNA interferase toxin, RelE/StbE family [Hydrogenimonas thermophila]|uniref:type II toxin-antitoxin system RelE family toxin n=1 Tax=Hydrogenimonas thermophila TaxID=223786 RepID=UPI002937337B|nr:type II toxin-antitoxin system mRNA interferase toxin, RelE/StbE family [Hydrogenimonas thermophila]WOE69010.1 type II toxin-antitoxin system mRNA interferase toxin, RelE/StbE family [Hydrogenimonas thermophila]WOE71521.1 type II toxin-antitoxin system mRNA interferase toxin, RelE/StbE family [Hydrogenimonas thermophila]
MYKVVLDKKVLKDLKQIDKKEQIKIIETIENRLARDPFIGKRLAGNLSEYYRYRVGNYRIIYLIYQMKIEIEIIKIGHRKDIYE